MKAKILIADKIHETAVKEAGKFAEVDCQFDITPEELLKKISKYDAIIVRSRTKVTAEVIKASKLKVIGRAGVGLDNIDVKAAKAKGIEIVNSPEASTIAVAEHTIALMLSIMRRIPHAHQSMQAGKWERKKFMGNELYNRTLGVIGFGRIGREVAMRAYAFGMSILAYDPNITHEDAREYNVKLVELDELLRKSDIITLHVPAVESTIGLINTTRLKLMKKSAILVNASRGAVVDEKALADALKNGVIAGAALDVYQKEPPEGSPLIGLDNVVLVPHIGASTDEAQRNAGQVVVDKIKNILLK
ncbi:MAG: hydroxyacid dehydrogenase [Candidatus Altiarchaeota archaeon]